MSPLTGNGQHTGDRPLSIDLAPEARQEQQARAGGEGITLTERLKRAVGRCKLSSQPGIVPQGATLAPDDPQCRHEGHQGLRWTEDTEPAGPTGTRTRIVAAQCTVCGRDQEQVRAVYPADETITVTRPAPGPAGPASAPESGS
jgi:hypothetical protein